MAANLTPDIYDIASLIEVIKEKYIDISEETLTMGIYGYLSEVFTNSLENTAIMAAEYCNEAVPTKAKFERNVISHALSLGINAIRATPANMEVFLALPLSLLESHFGRNTTLGADRFRIDKYMDFEVGSSTKYVYHLDFDIIIHRVLLPSGKYVYTATYDMDTKEKNEVTDITNPYLPALGLSDMGSSGQILMIPTVIRQIQRTEISKSMVVDNPLETKVITFEFEDQLAYFNVVVTEGGNEYYITPVYEGLSVATGYYCNYMYISDSKIRIKFVRDSYQPRSNATVIINVYTTKGSECNFEYKDDVVLKMKSDRESYDTNLWIMVRPIQDSIDGKDKDTVASIRKKIPKQMLLRGSVTTTTDINNYFNFLNSDDRRLYFLEKVHNQIERLYYSYFLLRVDGTIIPTNTLGVSMGRSSFASVSSTNFVIAPGKMYYLNPSTGVCKSVDNATAGEIDNMDNNGFLYINIFMNVINKNPFFTGYYMNVLHYTKSLNFDYINSDCECQFIATTVRVDRSFYSNRDKYFVTTIFEQNISKEFNLVTFDSAGDIDKYYANVYMVIFSDGEAIRYCKGNLIDYDTSSYMYTYQFTFTTDDDINKSNQIKIKDMLMIQTGNYGDAYLDRNVEVKFFVALKLDYLYPSTDYEGKQLSDILPSVTTESLSNVYSIYNGMDLFYDYTEIMTSYTYISKDSSTNQYTYYIDKMPLVRYKYMDTEEKITNFVSMIDKNRLYISSVLIFLEDSFGVDFKFFNTYGMCSLYQVDDGVSLDKTNLSLRFEIKFVQSSDYTILDDITDYIKDYVEDINDINDLHMPNLVTAVTTEFRKQLTYFKFIGVNSYDSLTQSLYREDIDEFTESTTVPEFLNISTNLDTGKPDITYTIIK